MALVNADEEIIQAYSELSASRRHPEASPNRRLPVTNCGDGVSYEEAGIGSELAFPVDLAIPYEQSTSEPQPPELTALTSHPSLTIPTPLPSAVPSVFQLLKGEEDEAEKEKEDEEEKEKEDEEEKEEECYFEEEEGDEEEKEEECYFAEEEGDEEEKEDETVEEETDLSSCNEGILDLPSPPTFLPIQDDELEIQEEIIRDILTQQEIASNAPRGSSPERLQVHIVSSEELQAPDRSIWRHKKAFSASVVQSLNETHNQSGLAMGQGDLSSKYLQFMASQRERESQENKEEEKVASNFEIAVLSEGRQLRNQPPQGVVHHEAVLIMGMAVDFAETAIPREEIEWVQDRESGQSFKVSRNLISNSEIIGWFFTKVMWVKAIQLTFIALWVLLVGQISFLKSCVVKSHDWAFYVFLGLFIALFTVTRLIGRRRSRWDCGPITALLILMTFTIAYPLASVQYKYDIDVVSVSICILLSSCILMGTVPFLCNCIATPSSWSNAGIVVTLLSGISILLISMFAERSLDIRHFTLYVWFPSLFIAEAILWVFVWEIRCMIEGYAFKVSESRWYFAALWV